MLKGTSCPHSPTYLTFLHSTHGKGMLRNYLRLVSTYPPSSEGKHDKPKISHHTRKTACRDGAFVYTEGPVSQTYIWETSPFSLCKFSKELH